MTERLIVIFQPYIGGIDLILNMGSFDEKSPFYTPHLCVLCLYNLQKNLNFKVSNIRLFYLRVFLKLFIK